MSADSAFGERAARSLHSAKDSSLASEMHQRDQTNLDAAPIVEDLQDAIAVVGMSCRFPSAPSIEAYWQNLRHGRCSFREVPSNRWSIEQYYDPRPETAGKSTSKWGAFVDDIDMFDALFFGIAPPEAHGMDPQQRLLLEVAWEALEDAGLCGAELAESDTAVFVGASQSEYGYYLVERPWLAEGRFATGSYLSIAANRISYALNLKGPSVVVDTACSSSLVAINLAVECLRRGESKVALAGGAQAIFAPHVWIDASRVGAIASDGVCRPFDNRAAGFVRGEGVGLVALMRLSDALRDRHTIHALVRGCAVNQDGRTNGLTAPSRRSQAAVLRTAYQRANVPPETVGLIEAHGTGTRLGDPIEVAALAQSLGEKGTRQRCALGSVKGNIGHLEPAAGIAGFIKVVLAVKHAELPPTLHIEEPNRELRLEDTPFYLNDRCRPWDSTSGPRRAGVSSFGFGGTNVHVVVEQPHRWRESVAASAARPRHLLVLSARSETALVRLVAAYHARLSASSDWGLDDVAFTAACGRAHFNHRVAILARDRAQLLDGLQRVNESGASPGLANSHIYAGAPGREPLEETNELVARLDRLGRDGLAFLATCCRGGRGLPEGAVTETLAVVRRAGESAPAADSLAQDVWHDLLEIVAWLYSQGAIIDWNALYGGAGARREALPTYPFERQRYWIDDPKPAAPPSVDSAGSPPTLPADMSREAEKEVSLRGAASPLGGAPAIYWPKWVERLPEVGSADYDLGNSAASSNWLVFNDRSALGRQLVETLRNRGERVLEVRPARGFARVSEQLVEIDPDCGADYARLLQLVSDRPLEVAHLWCHERQSTAATSLEDLDARLALGVRSLHHLVRAWPNAAAPRSMTVRFVTSGGAALATRAEAIVPEFAAAAGMLSSLANEVPSLATQWLDVPCDKELDFAQIFSEISRAPNERELVLRDGKWCTRGIEPVDLIAVDRRRFALRQGDVFLVTSGLSRAGQEVCRWLHEHYSARLVVTGRSELPAESGWSDWLRDHGLEDPVSVRVRALQALRKAGAAVTYAAVDVTDLRAMEQVVHEIRREHGELNGVFHLTGAIHDTLLDGKERLLDDEVMRPKIVGACVLDQVTRDQGVDLLVLFSSVSTGTGLPGQCEFVSANRYLDAFSAWRQAQGRSTLAIDWGLWGEAGMRIEFAERFGEVGVLAPMTTADALRHMERALTLDTPQLIIAGFDPNCADFTTPATPLAEQDQPHARSSTASETVLMREDLLTMLQSTLSRLLEIPEELLDPNSHFADLGVDSILIVKFSRELEALLHRHISFEQLQRHATLENLVDFLMEEVAGKVEPTPSAP